MGGRRHDKFKKMFTFLSSIEARGETFVLEDLADATGYKMSSIRTYYGKRLKGLLVEETEDEGVFLATGLAAFDEQSFIDYMTQRSSPADVVTTAVDPSAAPIGLSGADAVIEELLVQSSACFKLALELYHREHQPGGLVACCGLLGDAWRLLFDAETARIRGVEQLGDAALVTPHRGLADVLVRFFPNPRDPVRRNLEWLIHLHDSATHLLVPASRPYVSGLLQACVLNFRMRWEAVAERRLTDRGAGLLSMGEGGELITFEAIEARYGEHFSRRLKALVAALRVEEASLSADAFCADGSLRLVLTPRASEVDLELASHDASRAAVASHSDEDAYPYDAAAVVHEINKRLPYTTRLSSAAIEVIDVQHDVREPSGNRFYMRVDEPLEHRYSAAYVEWVSRSILEDSTWLERVRRAYERSRRS